MSSYLYHVGATATCPDGGQATTISTNTRVMVGGQAVATVADTTTVAGCSLASATPPSPCVLVRWTTAATRVSIGGQAALLQSSSGLCQNAAQVAQGAPAIVTTQVRVTGV